MLRGLPREVGVLSAVAFAVALGFGIVAPAIPVFAREFGVGRTAAGAVVSVFALLRFVSAPGCGRLVDRLGERTVLATGLGAVAVSSALAGLAQTYWQLLVLRGAGGVGSAMFTVSAYSLLLRTAEPARRGRATGVFQGGFLVGGITGPAFGGLLTGASVRLPFFVYAGTLALAGGIAVGALARMGPPGPDGPAAAAGPQRTSLAQALRDRSYRAALLTNVGSGWALFGVRSSLIPLFVVEGLRRGPEWTGLGFLLGAAAQAALLLPAGRFTDERGRRPAMVLGSSLATASMLLLAVSAALPGYALAMLMFGAGAAFLGVAPAAVVGDTVRGRGGSVVAAFQMASDLGAISGPLVAGWLADSVSFRAAFGSTAAVLAVGLVAAATMPRRPVGAREEPA
ncbi:MAG: MFS transporter [Mycobacteriales bacterium]